MRLTARDNAAQVERDLDRLAERIKVAGIRAVNALAAQAERAAFAEINAVYQIPAKTMSQYASTRLASQVDAEASITVKGKGFPLSVFKPVQNRVGVSVLLKGRRITIPHAFMVPRFGQHVFARGAYGGKGTKPTGQSFGRFQFGRTRLPINELYSLAPPDAFSNPKVVEAMDDTIAENAPKQLQRELSAIARGF